jgi:hypothetical protein
VREKQKEAGEGRVRWRRTEKGGKKGKIGSQMGCDKFVFEG